MTPRDPDIRNRCESVEILLKQANEWAEGEELLAAHLAAYLCVIMAGVVEVAVEHLVKQRATRTGDSEMARYVTARIDKSFRNPSWDTIVALLGEFSSAYRDEFKTRIPKGGPEAEALDSIIDNKNTLGHTGTWNLHMTLHDIQTYHERILVVLECLEDVIGPPRSTR